MRVVGLVASLLAFIAALLVIGDLRAEVTTYATLAVVATLLLYAGYGLLHRSGEILTTRTILLVALFLRLLALPLEPTLSDDAWRYLWDGRLLLEGASPYDGPPADPAFADYHDHLFELQGYPETNTIYPPLAQLWFASSVAFVTPHDAFSSLASFYIWKILLTLGELVGILLLLRLFLFLGRSRLPAILYAWHPLAVVEIAGQGHTDGLWVLALAIAFYGFVRGSAGRGAWGLGLGTAARIFPVLLAPLWYRFLSKSERIVGLITALPFLLLMIIFADPAIFERYSTVAARFTDYYEFNGGIYHGTKYLLDLAHLKPSNEIAGTITTGTLLLGVLLFTLWPLRRRTIDTLLVRSIGIITLQIALTAKSHVWYGVAPLFLITLERDPRFRPLWLWLALTAPLTYLYYAVTPNAESAMVLWIEWGGGALVLAGTRLRHYLSRPRLADQ